MPTYDSRVFLSVTVGRAREDINILHVFQSMKDLLCPKSGSLVNYSVSLLLKCKKHLDLFVLIISWKKEAFPYKGILDFQKQLSSHLYIWTTDILNCIHIYTRSMPVFRSKRNKTQLKHCHWFNSTIFLLTFI